MSIIWIVKIENSDVMSNDRDHATFFKKRKWVALSLLYEYKLWHPHQFPPSSYVRYVARIAEGVW